METRLCRSVRLAFQFGRFGKFATFNERAQKIVSKIASDCRLRPLREFALERLFTEQFFARRFRHGKGGGLEGRFPVGVLLRAFGGGHALRRLAVRRLNWYVRVEGERLRCAIEQGRDDDNEETIKKRLTVYHSQTSPLIDWYKQDGKYQHINGLGELDRIFADICTAIDKVK